MKAVLLGATRGLGRALAQELATRRARMFLLGRRVDDLAASAADLSLRGAPGDIGHAPCDLAAPAGFGAALDAADAALDGFDTVIVTAGVLLHQEQLEEDDAACAELLAIDFTNTVRFCEEARRRLMARGGGTLCVFSSVAGDRVRGKAVIYGAAKAGLSAYLDGLDHRYRRQGLVTISVRPGFIRTGMTAGQPEPPFASEPHAVARIVARALERGTPVVYAPGIWRWILLAVRSLPRWVMRRARF